MPDHDELLYQGRSRKAALGYLHRLCIVQHRDALLEPLCAISDDTTIETIVATWNQILQQDLESVIRANQTGQGELARAVLGLLFDHEGQAHVIQTVANAIREAYQAHKTQVVDALLWNVLSQHFKNKMDQLDGFGGGLGSHQLSVMNRLDRLRRELESQQRYHDMAELTAALVAEIKAHKLSNMPTTEAKVLEYLYVMDARYQASLDDDSQHVELISDLIAQPDTLIQLEQCWNRLTERMQQAIDIKLELSPQPAFLREQDFKQHFGFGWESLRKRASQALSALIDCIQQPVL